MPEIDAEKRNDEEVGARSGEDGPSEAVPEMRLMPPSCNGAENACTAAATLAVHLAVLSTVKLCMEKDLAQRDASPRENSVGVG
jgi:hypothetical protein